MELLKKFSTCFLLFNIAGIALKSYKVTHPSIGLSIYQHLQNKNYSVQEHTVRTQDDYLLKVQRIPCDKTGKFCNNNRPPILIMHGMSSLADDWVCRGEDNSLPLLLAKKGFDVWLGNNRGNTWSRNHTTLDPDQDAEFWNYSYNEMGMFDLPATIDYILKVTENKKLTYIGYSQGFTQLLVMGAERPEYNNKILLACGMAPVINMYNITNPGINLIGKYYKAFSWFTRTFSIYRIIENHSVLIRLFQRIAFSHPLLFDLLAIRLTCQYSVGASNNIDKVLERMFVVGSFSKYDYGFEDNLKIYNSPSPPRYNLTKVSMPVALFYSWIDKFVDTEDMKHILSNVPNIVEHYLVPDGSFDHVDFLHSNNVTNLVYNPLIKTIQKYNKSGFEV